MISEQVLTALVSAFAMGFLGSTHCIGMCGGLTVALNTGTAKEKSLRLSFTYQIFRVLSYGILGALVGGFGYLFSKWTNFPVLIVLGGIMLIMMGFYLLSWQNLLIYLESIGRKLWKKVSPVQSRCLQQQAGQLLPKSDNSSHIRRYFYSLGKLLYLSGS